MAVQSLDGNADVEWQRRMRSTKIARAPRSLSPLVPLVGKLDELVQ